LLKKTECNLVLIDIDITEFNGFEIAQKIRNHDKEIPIIALADLDRRLFLNKANKEFNNKFSGHLHKSSSKNVFYRGITK